MELLRRRTPVDRKTSCPGKRGAGECAQKCGKNTLPPRHHRVGYSACLLLLLLFFRNAQTISFFAYVINAPLFVLTQAHNAHTFHGTPDRTREYDEYVCVCGVSTHNEKLAKSTTIRRPQRPCESNGSPMGLVPGRCPRKPLMFTNVS